MAVPWWTRSPKPRGLEHSSPYNYRSCRNPESRWSARSSGGCDSRTSVHTEWRWLIVRAVSVISIALALAVLLSVKIPATGGQGRTFSVSQLVSNVASIGGAHETGNLAGTVNGRQQLWTMIYQKQVADGLLVEGYGSGPNVAFLAGGLAAEGNLADPLRSPHNSHLDVLARMGLVGFSLWLALWVGWYWRVIARCRRLAQRGFHARRQVAVLCLMITTSILVSSFFDPQLEGAQVAALLWTAFRGGGSGNQPRRPAESLRLTCHWRVPGGCDMSLSLRSVHGRHR